MKEDMHEAIIKHLAKIDTISMRDLEVLYCIAMLRRFRGVKLRTAREINLSLRTLQRKVAFAKDSFKLEIPETEHNAWHPRKRVQPEPLSGPGRARPH